MIATNKFIGQKKVKRPQRNLLIFLFILFIPAIADQFGAQKYALVFAGCLVALFLIMAICGKDFFIARYKVKQRDWHGAVGCYLKFEAFIKKLNALHINIPVFYSLYTYNGLALVKNNIAHCRMNSAELLEAKQLLLDALSLDKLYALPHFNLAIIAAAEGNEVEAMKEAEIAKQLGFSNKGAQKMIRNILAKTNETVGSYL